METRAFPELPMKRLTQIWLAIDGDRVTDSSALGELRVVREALSIQAEDLENSLLSFSGLERLESVRLLRGSPASTSLTYPRWTA
jgi:hypothetical protein